MTTEETKDPQKEWQIWFYENPQVGHRELISLAAWLEATRRQEEKIERLRKGIKMIINFIPDGWEMPLGYNVIVSQVKELLGEQ